MPKKKKKLLWPLSSFLMICFVVLFGQRKVGGVRPNPQRKKAQHLRAHLQLQSWGIYFRDTELSEERQIKQNLQRPWPFPESIYGPLPTAPEPFKNVEGLSSGAHISGNMFTEIIGPALPFSTWQHGSPSILSWPVFLRSGPTVQLEPLGLSLISVDDLPFVSGLICYWRIFKTAEVHWQMLQMSESMDGDGYIRLMTRHLWPLVSLNHGSNTHHLLVIEILTICYSNKPTVVKTVLFTYTFTLMANLDLLFISLT